MTMKDGHMEIETSAGTIVVCENPDDVQGCSILLKSKGIAFDINLCTIEVKDNPNRNRTDNETKKDVCVYLYGSYYKEKRTKSTEIRRGHVIDVFELKVDK